MRKPEMNKPPKISLFLIPNNSLAKHQQPSVLNRLRNSSVRMLGMPPRCKEL
jgi:hypothetical protein